MKISETAGCSRIIPDYRYYHYKGEYNFEKSAHVSGPDSVPFAVFREPLLPKAFTELRLWIGKSRINLLRIHTLKSALVHGGAIV